jgi:exoribonuclease II
MPKPKSNDNDVNLLQIARETMLEEGFKPDMPASVKTEVREVEKRQDFVGSSARDLRALLWSSIDNLQSRDLDQIEFAERMADGSVIVLIGIADVDAFVPRGSAIDTHAAENTTSVYTGITTFPMLPEELSNDKTSLVAERDRLAMVIDFIVGQDGSATTRDVYPALVRNKAKLSYEAIGNWLDQHGPIPNEVSRIPELEQQVSLQFDAARRLREVRKLNGSLELQTIQATPVTDENGRVTDLAVSERSSARDIIENFMVTANVAMAAFLEQRGVMSLRRVVRKPENWPRIVEIAREHSETLPSQPDPRALADFLERRQELDPIHFPDLSLAVVKLLGPGEYIVQTPGQIKEGHFGLAVNSYTHSTAPNRRYADLITQRLLKRSIAERDQQYTVEELHRIAQHCTERESAARKVERKMRKVAAAMFLRNRIGQDFDAIITGITPKGTFARVVRPPVDGLVVKGKERLKVGQEVRVKLLATDPLKGFIDFAVLQTNRTRPTD